jgi:hypothetical protein
MKFIDLLDVLDSDEQFSVIVTNEWGDGFYEGTVEHFREEELLLNLRVDRIFTRIIEDYEQSDYYPNRVLIYKDEIEVTLFDEEHKIIYRKDDEI